MSAFASVISIRDMVLVKNGHSAIIACMSVRTRYSLLQHDERTSASIHSQIMGN